MLRLEPQIDVEHANETAHQESRAHQQNRCESDFGNHQSIAQPGTLLARAQPASALLQRILNLECGSFERRQHSKQDPRENRREKREGKHVSVDAHASE